METFDAASSIAHETVETLPAPPDAIHVPAVAMGAKKRGRPAKVAPPSMGLFAAAANGGPFWLAVDCDTDDRIGLRLMTADCLMEVNYVGPNDRTLIPELQGRRGWSGTEEGLPQLEAHGDREGVLSAGEVAAALDHVSPAMSTDVTRYNLNGMFFDANNTWVATNGHRLHSFSGMETCFGKGVIVPAFAIKLLQKAIKAAKAQTVRIGWLSERSDRAESVLFDVDGAGVSIAFRVRLVDAQFPNYRQVIPSTENAHQFTVDAKEARTIIAAAPVIGDKCEGRDFSFNDSGVTTYRHDKRPSRIPCQYLAGCNVNVRLNAKYVDQALAECEGATTFYVGADDLTPLTVTNGRRLSLIMPMRK